MARTYYALATFRKNGSSIWAPAIVNLEEAVNNNDSIASLMNAVAEALRVPVETLILWVFWALDKAPQEGRYCYQITLINTADPVEFTTNVFNIPIPADSPEGMRILLGKLHPKAPLFIAPLQTDRSSKMTFSDFGFSAN